VDSPIDDNFGKPAPTPAREEKVRALVAAAFAGMAPESTGATETEVFSACMTLCATAIQAAHNMGAKPSSLRSAVHQLLLRCPEDEGTKVN
jgi:hypothetical protein